MARRITSVVYLLMCLLNICLADNLIKENKTGSYKENKSFYLGTDRVNWFQAFLNCRDNNRYLATILSETEEQELTEFLQNVTKDGTYDDGFWLSGSNLANTDLYSQYFWYTGGDHILYTDWLPGEPSGKDGKENCLQWVTYANESGWNDFDCKINIRYICQEYSY